MKTCVHASLFAIEPLLADAAASARSQAREGKARLELRPGTGSTFVRGDRAEVARALSRLLALILAGSAPEATIKVSCERAEENRARILIEGSSRLDQSSLDYERACGLLEKYGGEIGAEPPSAGLTLRLPFLAWSLSA